jgi:hypothetical protein
MADQKTPERPGKNKRFPGNVPGDVKTKKQMKSTPLEIWSE